MRGIEHNLSRFPAARALIAGAAILAGAFASAAQAQPAGSYSSNLGNGDETAMALPRIATRGAGGVGLPRPLAPSDAARIKAIFALQAHGRIPAALAETARLEDGLLLGHILADRYLGRAYRSSPAELTAWLERFIGQPDARAIDALLTSRAGEGAAPRLPFERVSPAGLPLPNATPDAAYGPEPDDGHEVPLRRNPVLDRRVLDRLSEAGSGAALRLIAATHDLQPAYAAQLRAEVAQILFTQNRDAEALSIAAAAMQRAPSDQQAGLAGYVAGLAAWRLDLPELARTHFEACTRAASATGALRAAGAFWAARAHLRTGDTAGYIPWMRRAAQEKRTFHGQLARRALGWSLGIAGRMEVLGEADVEAVGATPAGRRAFGLLQVDQPVRAEAELRSLAAIAVGSPVFGRSLLLVANAARLTGLAAQLGGLVPRADGQPRDDLRFPIPHLAPRGGFKVDPALVYALTRLESNFESASVSPAGARGLMQLMPGTARYVSGDPSLTDAQLHDPGRNLELGQRYVHFLAGQEPVGGDLIRLLASYNAGPGSFSKTSAAMRDNGDPLLFIEAIPAPETRRFVQRVLAYSWIYAARMNLPAPSLDQLSAGAFPRFMQVHSTLH